MLAGAWASIHRWPTPMGRISGPLWVVILHQQQESPPRAMVVPSICMGICWDVFWGAKKYDVIENETYKTIISNTWYEAWSICKNRTQQMGRKNQPFSGFATREPQRMHVSRTRGATCCLWITIERCGYHNARWSYQKWIQGSDLEPNPYTSIHEPLWLVIEQIPATVRSSIQALSVVYWWVVHSPYKLPHGAWALPPRLATSMCQSHLVIYDHGQSPQLVTPPLKNGSHGSKPLPSWESI